jgi:hypothetical protein
MGNEDVYTSESRLTPSIFGVCIPTGHERVFDLLPVAIPIAVFVNGTEEVQNSLNIRMTFKIPLQEC